MGPGEERERERERKCVRFHLCRISMIASTHSHAHSHARALSLSFSAPVFLCLSLPPPPLPPPHFLIVRFRQKLNQRKEELEAAFRAAKREHEQDREDDAKERDYKDLREKLWTNGHRITLASNLYVRVLLCAFLFPDSVPGRLDELRLYWRINLCIS